MSLIVILFLHRFLLPTDIAADFFLPMESVMIDTADDLFFVSERCSERPSWRLTFLFVVVGWRVAEPTRGEYERRAA